MLYDYYNWKLKITICAVIWLIRKLLTRWFRWYYEAGNCLDCLVYVLRQTYFMSVRFGCDLPGSLALININININIYKQFLDLCYPNHLSEINLALQTSILI